MKNRSFLKALFAIMLVLMLALTACSKESSKPADSGKTEQKGEEKEEGKNEEKAENKDGLYSIEDFNNVKTNEGEAIEGGNFRTKCSNLYFSGVSE